MPCVLDANCHSATNVPPFAIRPKTQMPAQDGHNNSMHVQGVSMDIRLCSARLKHHLSHCLGLCSKLLMNISECVVSAYARWCTHAHALSTHARARDTHIHTHNKVNELMRMPIKARRIYTYIYIYTPLYIYIYIYIWGLQCSRFPSRISRCALEHQHVIFS